MNYLSTAYQFGLSRPICSKSNTHINQRYRSSRGDVVSVYPALRAMPQLPCVSGLTTPPYTPVAVIWAGLGGDHLLLGGESRAVPPFGRELQGSSIGDLGERVKQPTRLTESGQWAGSNGQDEVHSEPQPQGARYGTECSSSSQCLRNVEIPTVADSDSLRRPGVSR